VRRVGSILAAATHARWPMYLRNVKQILRASDGGFDERRYGFGGLMDLLKACQRASLVRIERDRRGGLRLFQGSALQTGAFRPAPTLPQPDVEDIIDVQTPEVAIGESASDVEPMEVEAQGPEPIPIDTTAELLGRAKARKPRARAARPAAAPRKTAAKRPARRGSKKSAAAEE